MMGVSTLPTRKTSTCLTLPFATRTSRPFAASTSWACARWVSNRTGGWSAVSSMPTWSVPASVDSGSKLESFERYS